MEELKPGEKLYEVSILLRDEKGAIAKVAKLLAEANVNIKTGSLFYVPGEKEVGCWTSFIDISKSTKSALELEKELRMLDVVLNVKFGEPKPAPYEIMHFPVLHGDERAIIMPIELFGVIWDGVEKILAPSGFSAVIYDAGKNSGEFIIRRLKRKYKLEGADLIEALGQATKALGFGIPEALEIDFTKPSGTIIIRECMEAISRKEKPYKVCHWSRGFLAGTFTAVFGKPVEVIETMCLAAGDEYCKFQIRPQTPLEEIKISQEPSLVVAQKSF